MTSKLLNSFYLIMLSLIASQNVFADAISNQILETNLNHNASKNIFKNISGSIGIGYDSNFYEYNNSDKEQEINMQLEFYIKKDDWKYGATAVISKPLIKEEKAYFSDTNLFITKPLYLFAAESSFSSSVSAYLELPTSIVSRYERTMYGNLSVGPALGWNNNNFNIFLLPRVGKVFNKYKTSFLGEANTSYYTKLSIAPTYQINNYLSTQFTTSIAQSWTDNHSLKAPTYATELNIDFKLATTISLSLAISNDGKIYKSNGTSSNVKIFDKELSAYSITLVRDF